MPGNGWDPPRARLEAADNNIIAIIIVIIIVVIIAVTAIFRLMLFNVKLLRPFCLATKARIGWLASHH
jgi:hypothetical protein